MAATLFSPTNIFRALAWVLLSAMGIAAPHATGRLVDVGCGDKPYEALFAPHVSAYVRAHGARNVHVAPQSVDNDFWRSREAYERFRAAARESYASLDAACEGLTASERHIGSSAFGPRQPTLPFNGYAAQVASLYSGMDLRKYF